MKLNHLNLTVTDVSETRKLFEKHFGLRRMEGGKDENSFALLFDDNGLVLTLMNVGQTTEVKYPASFHIGFRQESKERVNEINQRLRDDGMCSRLESFTDPGHSISVDLVALPSRFSADLSSAAARRHGWRTV